MIHRSTIAIFSEWQRLARTESGYFRAPTREQIEPRKLGRHLSDLFFLEAEERGDLSFRLAGTRICTLFGRELKNTRFLSLWSERDRAALRELSQNVSALEVPALVSHVGISMSGRSLGLEMFLAPLEAPNGQINLLGSVAVLDSVNWVGADPIVLGHLNSIEPVAPDLVLADEVRKSAAITVNAAGIGRQWTNVRLTKPQEHAAPKLRVIKGGKA
ncbi:PAS domain-containing protein [Ochrobactrum vermis]|uniref:PAS domain-containing protein n=1 Tax=Ochrobactrum vermis TaxID=1827297 RepID=A0ABU8PBN9_9HYPH|nr:PAS domain-containing protein [Ochrobactrum vermis]PQZ31284.1 PAS domain-containing protein [Ochrobactrum vermis]